MADWVCVKLTLGLVEVLQRRHGAGIGVDAKGHGYSPLLLVVDRAFCGPVGQMTRAELLQRAVPAR